MAERRRLLLAAVGAFLVYDLWVLFGPRTCPACQARRYGLMGPHVCDWSEHA